MNEDQFAYEVTRELFEEELSADPEYKIWSENVDKAEKREREKAYINHLIKEESTNEFDRERYGWW